MTSFSQIATALFFVFVGVAIARDNNLSPNVPWITQEDGESFLLAFEEAISEKMQPDGIIDLEFLFGSLLSLIPQKSGSLSVARLQALNMALASIIAEIVTIDGRGSMEEKIEFVREGLIKAFLATSGFVNTAFIKEVLSMIRLFYEEEEGDNTIDQNFPQQEYPEIISQFESAGKFETFDSVVGQQASTEASQSSSTVSTTTSTSQTYSEQTASSSDVASTAATSEASSLFTQYVTSFLLQDLEFVDQYNTIASSGTASTLASASAEAVAYSIGQGSIASVIASAVSQATANISLMTVPFVFVHAYATTVSEILSAIGVLNLDNVNTLASEFANSLFNAILTASASSTTSASASSETSASTSSAASASTSSAASASTSSAASASTSSVASASTALQTDSTAAGSFASSGTSSANYGPSFGIESPFFPDFGVGSRPNTFDFLTPSPSIPALPTNPELSRYSPLISELLQSPSGLKSPAADERIASSLPLLALAVTNGFNPSLFSVVLSSLVSQISQSSSFTSSQVLIEAILEIISGMVNILTSADLGLVSTASLAGTVSSIAQSISSSIIA